MITKNTKGEWIESHEWVKNVPCIRSNGNIVCEISIKDKSIDETKANAMLIAAAPKLLKACLNAIVEITNHESGHQKQFQDVYAELENAINEAVY